MPLSVFTSLQLGPLKFTGVVIQLANRSIVNPADVLEDVLVRVDKLIFPTDFYILDMKDDEEMSSTTTILGRPFMMTARTKIDVHAGSLTLELKPLPSHLKYVYLERDGKLPVIIYALLIDEQEQKLLQVIKDHKRAIGWTLTDIPGISPSFCMHRILLEEDAKPVRQPQRRLNPQLMEVVRLKPSCYKQVLYILFLTSLG